MCHAHVRFFLGGCVIELRPMSWIVFSLSAGATIGHVGQANQGVDPMDPGRPMGRVPSAPFGIK